MALNFSRPSGSRVIDHNMQNTVLINKSRTAWRTKISMPFLSFSENLLLGAYIHLHVDNFEIAHRKYSMFV